MSTVIVPPHATSVLLEYTQKSAAFSTTNFCTQLFLFLIQQHKHRTVRCSPMYTYIFYGTSYFLAALFVRCEYNIVTSTHMRLLLHSTNICEAYCSP